LITQTNAYTWQKATPLNNEKVRSFALKNQGVKISLFGIGSNIANIYCYAPAFSFLLSAHSSKGWAG
jgi:hypothetical protein